MLFQGNVNKHTEVEQNLFKEYAEYFEKSESSTISKLQNYTKYVRRQYLSRFLAKNELYNCVLRMFTLKSSIFY